MNKYSYPILLCFLIASFSAGAEDLLSKRLSITFRETPLKQALDEVAKLADFEWTYNARILDSNRRITLNAKDWTVRETLQEILGEGYAFKTSGKYLILKKQTPPKTSLSGVIRDPITGERLSNVTVYDRKTLRATKTDSSGYYALKIKRQTEVSIVRLGYRDTTLRVTSMSPRYQKIELSPVEPLVSDTANTLSLIKKSLRSAATELDYFFASTRDKWHDLNIPDTLHRRFQISFLPVIGTNHVLSGKVENDWSVNILAGQSAGVRRVELAGLGNFTQNRVQGFQAAGVFNVSRGNCNGVQAAGIFNLNQGNCHGIQAAGVLNQTNDTLHGVQLAGLVNVAHESPKFFLQASGVMNIVRIRDSTTSLSKVPKGIQVAGLINKAEDINGLQISGLINRSRRMRGVQIGLFNSANEIHGLQIGLINRSGRRWLPFFNWGH